MALTALFSEWNTESEKAYFSMLCHQELLNAQNCYKGGVGTLGEKRMHRVLKQMLRTPPDCQEVRIADTLRTDANGVDGAPAPRFVADVLCNNTVFEIQTGSFYPLRKKLLWCIQSTPYDLALIHPIPAKRHLAWIDPISGEVGRLRRVAGTTCAASLASELYWLRPILCDPAAHARFCLVLPLLEVQDYKWKNGYSADGKKGATRYERIPTALLDTVVLSSPADYAALFLPPALPAFFTAQTFSACSRIRGRAAYSVLHLLCDMQILAEAGKQGRSVLYKRL